MLLSDVSPDARATEFGLNIAFVGVSTGIASLAFKMELGGATCEIDPKAGVVGYLISFPTTVGVAGTTFGADANIRPIVPLGKI